MSRPPTAPARGRRRAPRRRDVLAAQLPALREALARQRDFRRVQLQAHRQGTAGASSPTMREVATLVEAGARHALDDIELALARIRTGEYGRCRACGTGIHLAVLAAIPQTTLCLGCHRRGAGDDPPAGQW